MSYPPAPAEGYRYPQPTTPHGYAQVGGAAAGPELYNPHGGGDADAYYEQPFQPQHRSTESESTLRGDPDSWRSQMGGSRTPSPTPSELEFLQKKGFSSIDFKNFKKYFSRKYIVNWIVIVMLIAITVVTIVLHDKIVNWLEPLGRKIEALHGGFLIPIAILVVVSFPPLFGHELIAIVTGVIWGPGLGFAIVAAGTLLGEIASFLVFRYACVARSRSHIEKSLKLGLLAKVVREGGWKIVLMARLSAIPPHFTTIIFAVCGTDFWVFLLVAIVTLPRQFATVYLGVLAASNGGTKTTGQRIISYVVIGVTIAITIFSMRYINARIDQARPGFIYERRKARQQRGDAPPPFKNIESDNGDDDAYSFRPPMA